MTIPALRCRRDANGTASARPIFDDDRLSEIRPKGLCQNARRTIGRAPWREWNDDAYRSGRPNCCQALLGPSRYASDVSCRGDCQQTATRDDY
jgi:hypothetical protein